MNLQGLTTHTQYKMKPTAKQFTVTE